MKAVFPAIRDRSTVGAYIARECKGMPIYGLEKMNITTNGKIIYNKLIYDPIINI